MSMSSTDDLADPIAFRHQIAERFPISAGGVLRPMGTRSRWADRSPWAAHRGIRRGRAGPDDRLVVHVRDLHVEERPGPELRFDEASEASGVGLAGAQVSIRVRAVVGAGVVLGQLDGATFSASSNAAPFGEELVRPASADEAAAVFETLDASVPTIVLGQHRDHPGIPARVRSAGFSRHTFMCGQSGSGKTYTTGVLFERLLMGSTLDVIVLDPNSDHVMLGSLADADDARPEAERYRSVQQSVRRFGHVATRSTHTLCIDFSDLDPEVQAKLLHLDPIADLDAFNGLQRITAGLPDAYSITDVAEAALRHDDTSALARRIENLRLADWGLWRRDGEMSAAAARPDTGRADGAAVVHRGRHRQPRHPERTNRRRARDPR